ncbi:MAG: hypothetical protein ACTSVD_02730 [Candidatus Thorarchaeota archaeon]
MVRERGMFRVYVCPSCGNVGYAAVDREDEESTCSLCGATLVDELGMLYAATLQEAESEMRNLVLSHSSSKSKPLPTRGAGVKRRVQMIVEVLIDMNHGRPVPVASVLRECVDAGIDLERAIRFLSVLEQEGRIRNDGVVVELEEVD